MSLQPTSALSHGAKPPTPTTRPAVPMQEPPPMTLPTSIQNTSYLPAAWPNEGPIDDNLDPIFRDAIPMGTRRGSMSYNNASVARSLTNNHSYLPPSSVMNDAQLPKQGQSPTILSILSGDAQSHSLHPQNSLQQRSAVPSSRNIMSTAPHQPLPQQTPQQLPYNQFTQENTIYDDDDEDFSEDEGDDLAFNIDL